LTDFVFNEDVILLGIAYFINLIWLKALLEQLVLFCLMKLIKEVVLRFNHLLYFNLKLGETLEGAMSEGLSIELVLRPSIRFLGGLLLSFGVLGASRIIV